MKPLTIEEYKALTVEQLSERLDILYQEQVEMLKDFCPEYTPPTFEDYMNMTHDERMQRLDKIQADLEAINESILNRNY